MQSPLCIAAWLYFDDQDDSLSGREIAAILEQAGVIPRPLNSDSPPGIGVVIFGQFSPQVRDLVRSASCNGQELLLAVTTSEAIERGATWPVLQAGASDVLAWDKLQDPAGTVVARLQRWKAIDDIVKSPLVQKNLVGCSHAWISLLRQIVEVARFTDASVLLTGETGTGKELVARLIHTLSPERSKHELVILDCTTIVPDLAGSELFGHERGAFTGAVAARDGAFAMADGGTLFLDEVGDLPLGLQPQLLRTIQEHTYKRVGSNVWHQTNFRLVCATNRVLVQEERCGHFRRDLYYRIADWTFNLPPLRDRTEDILPLARHFIAESCKDENLPELDRPVREFLITRNYLGNVRDLRNLVLRMTCRHVGKGPITIGDIPADERPPVAPGPNSWQDGMWEQSIHRALLCGVGLREIRRAVEDTVIHIALDEENGNLQQAARKLGVTDRTLQMRRAEHRLQPARNGDGSAKN